MDLMNPPIIPEDKLSKATWQDELHLGETRPELHTAPGDSGVRQGKQLEGRGPAHVDVKEAGRAGANETTNLKVEKARTEHSAKPDVEQSVKHPSKGRTRESGGVVTSQSDTRIKPDHFSQVPETNGYGIGDLLRYFESHKPEGFENVSLHNGKDGLEIIVNDAKFTLHDARIITRSSGPDLLGKPESSEKEIRFQFDREKITPRFGCHLIKRMEASEYGLSIIYQRGSHEHTFSYRTVKYVDGKPVVEGTLWRQSDGRFTFTIPKSLFLSVAQKDLKIGKEYEIRGRINENHTFATSHFESGKSARSTQVHFVFRGDEKQSSCGQKCKITIDSVTEKEIFVVSSGRRPRVYIGRRSLMSMGFLDARVSSRDNMLEFHVRNVSRPSESSKKYFLTLPSEKKLTLSAGRIGARSGDCIQITGVGPYRGGFVRDFNEHKPGSLGNVELRSDETGFSMLVDEKQVPLRSPRLTTVDLRLELTANLGDSKTRIRLYFDGERITTKIDRYLVQEIKASDASLSVSYLESQRPRTFRYKRRNTMLFDPVIADDYISGKAPKPMSAQERALWEDAEGSYSVHGYGVKTSQKFIEPLIDYCEGARRDGIRSAIAKREPKRTEKMPNPAPYYEAYITGAAHVAREILLTERWHRHPGRIRQIEKVKEELKKAKPRYKAIQRAREILGIS
jgi:hypothetical protein